MATWHRSGGDFWKEYRGRNKYQDVGLPGRLATKAADEMMRDANDYREILRMIRITVEDDSLKPEGGE